jgi:hypothetical protein
MVTTTFAHFSVAMPSCGNVMYPPSIASLSLITNQDIGMHVMALLF